MGNSVIYRPAYDAEVEYLESTGTQFIDTGVKPTNTTKWKLDALLKKADAFQQMGSFLAHPSYSRFGIGIETSGRFNMSYGNSDNITNIISDELRHSFAINALDKTWTIDDTSGNYDSQESIVASMPNICLFARGVTSGVNRFVTNGRIYKSKIWDNSTLVRDFIPVRIGQIGYLYDKVSKQLFANKGTGNFVLGNDVSNAVIPQQRCVLYFGNQRSVGYERIYEEYEWLKGDGSAYLYLGNISNSIEFDADIQSSSKSFEFIYGYNGALRIEDRGTKFGTVIPENRIILYQLPFNGRVKVDLATHGAYANGVQIAYTNRGTDGSNDETAFKQAYFFGIKSLSQYRSLCKIGNVLIDGNKTFVPCRLLQSIPAILDGNGIARAAGECGMWDKVSNRFYGNVANSGTFTVKGPKCYEEYEWLKVQTTTQTGTYLTLSLGTSMNFSFKRVWLSDFWNTWYFHTPGYVYYTDTHRLISIWDSTNSGLVNSGDTSTISVGDVITIESTPNLLLINGKTINRYNYVSCAVSLTNTVALKITSLTSSITVDDSVRYVPCKLTHGIPASMDANGIARPAGTCGMWDKVNDVFYGNVANSGSFTVSND